MRILLLITVALIPTFGIVSQDLKPDSLGIDWSKISKAKTIAETQVAYSSELTRSEAKMAEILKLIYQKYSKNGKFLRALAENQKNWIIYRDSFLQTVFPAKDSGERDILYGSDGQIQGAKIRIEMNWDRSKQLSAWLGTENEYGSYGRYYDE